MNSTGAMAKGTKQTTRVISFHVFFTPIEILERLAAVGPDVRKELTGLLQRYPELEIVPVHTCNRFEFYFRSSRPSEITQALFDLLAHHTGLSGEHLQTHARVWSDRRAVRYLFESISGLQSIALGEHQILGQIRNAYLEARENRLARKELIALFETALHAGKRVRTETRLGLRQFSLSKMALREVVEQVEDPSALKVVIIGTGKMARAAAEYLLNEGIEDFRFFSRHPEERRFLVEAYGKPVLHFDELPEHAPEADVLFTAYGTAEIIVGREFLAATMADRSRPLYIIDIAMPRDVDPGVASLNFVRFTDFHSLYNSRWRAEMTRDPEVRRAQELIEEESRAYERLEKQREIAGTIRRLHDRFGEIARNELDRTLRGMSHLSEKDQRKIEKMVHSITQKILHHPTALLRERVCEDDGHSYLHFVEEMVNLKIRNEAKILERSSLEKA